MTLVDEYKNAKGIIFSRIESFANPYRPVPTLQDYSLGYIMRYFSKFASDRNSAVVEIDKKQFDSHAIPGRGIDSRIYKVISLRWKISGTLQEVQKFNFEMISNLENTFPGIQQKLQNVLEFWELSQR